MGFDLYDMHLHLDGFDDPLAVADGLAARGVAAFAATVTPRCFELNQELATKPNVRLAVGMHPWYLEDGGSFDYIDKAIEHAAVTRWVGEVGLDFYERHAPEYTWAPQRYALKRILEACAEASDPKAPHVVSLHSVRSASAVLDLLEETGAGKRCACIFHWFGGSTDELWRAIRMGCWFSVGPFMMDIKRSHEYVKLIPKDRFLLETDYPPGNRWQEPDAWAAEVREKLLEAAASVAAARSCPVDEVLAMARENSAALLEMD